MQEMTKNFAGLVKRGNKWIVRKRVPDELRPIIGKREITKSLGTDDFSKAKKDFFLVMADIEQGFEVAKLSLSNVKEVEISIIQAERLAKIWFVETCGEFIDHSYDIISNDEIELATEELDHFQKMYTDNIEGQVQQHLQSTADDILMKNGYSSIIIDEEFDEKRLIGIDKASKGYQKLIQLIRRYHLEALKKRRAILNGKVFGEFADQAQQTLIFNNTNTAQLTIGELVKEYIYANQIDENNRNSKSKIAALNLLQEVHGSEKIADEMSYDDYLEFFNLLRRLPPNARKLKSRQKMTLYEIAKEVEENNEKLLSTTSVNKYMNSISTMMRWAMATGKISKDYSANDTLRVKDNLITKIKSKRLPFSIDDLNSLFSSKHFTDPNKNKPSTYWLPLISLFHGMRMQEILQLKIGDIKSENGVRYFKLHAEEGSHLKNTTSWRNVPVHPLIWEFRFASLLEMASKRVDSRLFPDVTLGKGNRYSEIYTRRFSRYLEKIGIKKEKISFHSFRHNFRDAGRNCQIPVDRILQIGGWSNGSGAQANYGSGINLIELEKAIEQVRYDGLDLGSIKKIDWE